MSDVMKASEGASAEVIRAPGSLPLPHIPADGDGIDIKGRFDVICYDKDGNEKWRDHCDNVVATVGANLLLDTLLSGAAYTVTGPYMGLIGLTGWTATSSADVMAQLAGTNAWREAGGTASGPTYSGTRRTCVWSAASGRTKALSTALNFNFTGAGTVEGCFIVTGTGAVATIDSATGVLFSAGAFSGGAKVVAATDQINVSYSVSV